MNEKKKKEYLESLNAMREILFGTQENLYLIFSIWCLLIITGYIIQFCGILFLKWTLSSSSIQVWFPIFLTGIAASFLLPRFRRKKVRNPAPPSFNKKWAASGAGILILFLFPVFLFISANQILYFSVTLQLGLVMAYFSFSLISSRFPAFPGFIYLMLIAGAAAAGQFITPEGSFLVCGFAGGVFLIILKFIFHYRSEA